MRLDDNRYNDYRPKNKTADQKRTDQAKSKAPAGETAWTGWSPSLMGYGGAGWRYGNRIALEQDLNVRHQNKLGAAVPS
jgi:hypothetical protein